MITYDDFKKVELKVVTVLEASRVEGSDKLLKLLVDDGSRTEANLPAGRQVIAGIGKAYEPEVLIGKQITIVANLEPRMLMGLESQGMVLAAHAEVPVLLFPASHVEPGASIS